MCRVKALWGGIIGSRSLTVAGIYELTSQRERPFSMHHASRLLFLHCVWSRCCVNYSIMAISSIVSKQQGYLNDGFDLRCVSKRFKKEWSERYGAVVGGQNKHNILLKLMLNK